MRPPIQQAVRLRPIFLEKPMRKRQLTRQSPRWIVLMFCCTAASAGATPADASTDFMGVTWSSTAESAMKSTPGPIARAIAREAARLTVDPRAGSAEREWPRVRKLAPGTEIIVTVEGSQPGGRYVVRADESDLTVLNVADPPLPAAVKAVLRGVASSHPDYFSAAQQGGTFVLEQRVRLQLDGVFLGDRKVADLGQLLENIARDDIAEIKTRQRGRGVWGHLGALGGYFVGAMSGGVVAGLACQAADGRDRCDSGAFLTGMLGGGIAGGVYGFRAANRETEDVIYRAPQGP
jgi:hypothetical protein